MQTVEALDCDIIVTQGFIARIRGRGDHYRPRSSDTSAALLAAGLGARRCEIWTDVPGLFTANPRQVPSARLIRTLDFAEAQEIASTGARVLHPRCVPPLRAAGIPLEVRCTPSPEMPSTRIEAITDDTGPSIKAISSRKGVVLVTMETVGMWQQVGFLAEAFACFKAEGLSIDLVATSETSVTVSLDPAAAPLDEAAGERLLQHLRPLCEPRLVRGCAAVSLVGRRISASPPQRRVRTVRGATCAPPQPGCVGPQSHRGRRQRSGGPTGRTTARPPAAGGRWD